MLLCIAHTLDAKTFATRLRGVDALIAGHEHINLNEKVTGADGKTIHVVEAGSAFAEVGLLSIPYKYDTNGTETTDDDTVTVPADGSDEKLLHRQERQRPFDRPRQGLRLPKPP